MAIAKATFFMVKSIIPLTLREQRVCNTLSKRHLAPVQIFGTSEAMHGPRKSWAGAVAKALQNPDRA